MSLRRASVVAAGVLAAALVVAAPGQAAPDGWQAQRTVVTGSAAQDLRPRDIAINGTGRSYVLYTCGQGAVCGRYQRVDGRPGAQQRLFGAAAAPAGDIDVALDDSARVTVVWTSADGALLARRANRQGWVGDAVEVGPPGASDGREQRLGMQADGDLEILWRPPEPWVWSYRQLRADNSLTDAPVRVEGQVFDVHLVDQTLAVVAVDQAQTLRFSKLSDGAALGEPTVVDEGTVDRIVPSAAVSMTAGGDAVVAWRTVVGNQSTVASRHLPASGAPSETYLLEGPRRGPYSLDLARTRDGLRVAYMVGGELWGRRLTDQGASAGEATLLQRRYFSQPVRLHPMGGRVVFFHAKRGGRAPVLVRSWDGRRDVAREGPVLSEPEYRALSGDRSPLVVAQAGRHLAAAVGWTMPRTEDWQGWSRVKSAVNDPRSGS